MSTNDLHDSLTERLAQLEEGIRGLLSARGGGQSDSDLLGLLEADPGRQKEELARQQALADLLSNPALLEEMFAPLAEHLHFLRVESEFSFRLLYCVREFIKQYLVREQTNTQLPQEKRPAAGPNQAEQLDQILETLMLAEQIEFDGRALTALEAIRSGKIYEQQTGASQPINHDHTAPGGRPANRRK